MKINKAFMDRVVRPNLNRFLNAYSDIIAGPHQEIGEKVTLQVEAAALDFLASVEDAMWEDLGTSRKHKGLFLVTYPDPKTPKSVAVYWSVDNVLMTSAHRKASIMPGMKWRPMPTYRWDLADD